MTAWSPPLNGGELWALLQKVRRWEPFDGGELLDDVADVLDDPAPTTATIGELVQRLHKGSARLTDIAIAAGAQDDATTARLIESATWLGSQPLPGDHGHAVAYARRVAWTTNELLERLVALRCLKEAV
ncbi:MULTISPECIES: DUF6415 family natural product biosynthesis protein [unclassified Streptomyces]|uniref:DUF6415 family natural product biosynthesis protein n=1 Tax=unclassified Streptomyces TaxID=2593676 RepID=UPI0036F99CAC